MFSMLNNLSSEEMFPNIQPKTPLVQLSSCPTSCYMGEDTDPHLATDYKVLLFVAHINVGAGSKTEQSPNTAAEAL